MQFIIDRIEGEYAVVEIDAGKIEKIPMALLPEGSREGDVILIMRDENLTAERREQTVKRLGELFRKKN